MPAFIIALVLLFTVSAGGGTALASQGALPENDAYPAKLTLEGFQTAPLEGEAATPLAITVKDVAFKADPHVAKDRPTVEITGTLGITFTNTITDVKGLVNDPDVPGESQNGLLAKLKAAQAAIQRGKVKTAVNKLGAFLNQMNAMKQSEHISISNYDALYARYSAIVEALGATPKAALPPVLLPDTDAKSETPEPAASPDQGRRLDKKAHPSAPLSPGKSGNRK